MSKKIIQVEINDNRNLSDEELKDRYLLLAIKFKTISDEENFKKGLELFAEMSDILDILEERNVV